MPRKVPPPPPTLARFLEAYPSAIRELALAARTLLLQKHPDLTEKVWPGWKVIGYGRGPRMSDFVVGIGPAKAHLGVHLAGGASLDDPSELLRGSSSSARHIRVTSVEQLASRDVRRLIDAAFELAAGRDDAAQGNSERAVTQTTRVKETKTGARRDGGDWERPVSDASVLEKTGRDWADWVRTLDAEGCATMTHREIVAVVGGTYGVGPWWQQMITVGYERARGLRDVHQTTGGYQVGGSKTVNVPLDALWKAWCDTRARRKWLPATFTVRKATEPKSLRITWHDGSDLQVLFYAKGDAKSQVTVDHRKLPPSLVDEMKTFWQERLALLKEQLERRA